MAQTKRDKLKRTTAQAYNDLDRAMANVLELKAVFAPVHPDFAEYLEKIAKAILVCQQFLLAFWKLAWGKVPSEDVIESYRG